MAYKYKIKEEEGSSKYYPGGKTPGLTTSVMNQILKKIAKGNDEDKEVKTKLKEEGESSFPDQLKGNDDIIWKKNWERNNQANYGAFYKGHDIEHGGVTFGSVDRLHKYIKSYILSNNWYNKLKYAKPLDENTNPQDIISVDVPLFIRLLEYAREDAKTDMDLHDVAENIIKLSAEGKPLTMANYDAIVSKAEGIQEVNLKASKLSSSEYQKAKKLKDFKDSDWNWNAEEDLYNKVNEEGEGGSMSNAAGGYLGKFAYKLPKKQPKLEEDAAQSAKPNAKNPGASLGAGPAAGKSGVSNNAYVKQFKYKVVPQTKEGTYVQKGSGMEVKKLF